MLNRVQTLMQTLLISALLLCAGPTQADDSRRSELIQREQAREAAGDVPGAINVCMEILRSAPNDVQTLNVMAGLYGSLGKFEDEIIWAKKAIAADATYHLAYVNYGNALVSKGRLEEGRSAFEKARSLAPNDPLPVYSLGVIAERKQKFKEAISLYEKSVQLDPKFENGLYNLAAMYANVKRYDDALATLDKLLKLNPAARDAQDMQHEIERAKKGGRRN